MARKKPLERDEVVTEARARYELAQDSWGPIYAQCREDMRFSDPTDPKQWPQDAINDRKKDGRPALTFDQTSQFVRQVINTARRNKPAITFLPVDDKSDPKLADVLKGLARHTEYTSRAEVAYNTALNHATRGGIGWFRLIVKEIDRAEVKGQQCAEIRRVVDFSEVLVDPTFLEPDGSDMEWGFVESAMAHSAFKAKWPDAKIVDWDDKGWFTKETVRVCEYYRVVKTASGKVVEHFTLSGEEVLDKSVFPSEYVPLFPVLGNEEWHEGKRSLSGCIRLARDAQITYNFERNAAYEAAAVGPKAPWLAPVESIEGHENIWKTANRGNHAYLPFNTLDEQGNPLPYKPERVNPAGVAAGWVDLSERSKADIQAALGMYNAAIGDNPNNQSGRAVLALQEKADVGTFHYIDNLALSVSHCGRVLTQIWPVIYDQAQVVRIIGEDDDPSFVTLDPQAKTGYQELKGPSGQKQIVINPGVGKYDVRATVGPAFQTRQQEAAAEIGEMVNGNPQLMAILGDVLVKLRNYPEADKISRRFKAMLPPQIQQAEQGDGQAKIPPEVVAHVQGMEQQLQQLQQALQEAQSGVALEHVRQGFQERIEQEREATKRYIAELNNDTKRDTEELKGMVSLLLQKLQPPPQLAGEVAGDLAE